MIKKKLQPLSRKLESKAKNFPFHPTVLTVLGVLFAIVGLLIAVLTSELVLGLILFLFAFAIDAIDGMVARARGLVSKQGAFLDGVFDRLVEFLLILTLWMIFPWNMTEQLALIFILFFGTAMTSFVKAYAEHSGMLGHRETVTMPGILERTERSVLLLLVFLLIIIGSTQWLTVLLYLIAALSLVTFLQRIYRAINS